MTAGRPPKFATPDNLWNQVYSFFDECKAQSRMPTKANLALYLHTTRETLGDYEKKEGFSDAIKYAYATAEDAWVQKLAGNTQVAGSIFYLKNAFQYRDKIETDITTGGDKIGYSIMQYGPTDTIQLDTGDAPTSSPQQSSEVQGSSVAPQSAQDDVSGQ